MPLNPQVLLAEFQKISQSKPSSRREAARKYALAYETYARDATASGVPVVLTGQEKVVLEQTLATFFEMPVGAPPIFATGFALGVQLFWTAPPTTFGAGAIFPPVWLGYPIALAGITALVVNPLNTDDVYNEGLSTILDTTTHLLTVLIPPAPTPVPVV